MSPMGKLPRFWSIEHIKNVDQGGYLNLLMIFYVEEKSTGENKNTLASAENPTL